MMKDKREQNIGLFNEADKTWLLKDDSWSAEPPPGSRHVCGSWSAALYNSDYHEGSVRPRYFYVRRPGKRPQIRVADLVQVAFEAMVIAVKPRKLYNLRFHNLRAKGVPDFVVNVPSEFIWKVEKLSK